MTQPLSLSPTLLEECRNAWKKKGSNDSFDAFVEGLLRKALNEEHAYVYSPHDERAIKERLQSLGYLD